MEIGISPAMRKFWEAVENAPEMPPCTGTDPEIFHPQLGDSSQAAIKMCNSCPVKLDCLIMALEDRIDEGIYGGMHGRARRDLRVQLSKAARLKGHHKVAQQLDRRAS